MKKKVIKNTKSISKEVIVEQMLEARPLPLGREEFEDWSARIMSGALVSATLESQKFTLCTMLMHLGPTESHKPDAYFIHGLRKAAVNQVAHAILSELHEAKQKREVETVEFASEELVSESADD